MVVAARGPGYKKIRDPAAIRKDVPTIQSSIAGSVASKIDFHVPTDKILELAQYIKDQNMSVIMPKYILFSYKRAVSTREAYARRYATEELQDQKSNDGHIYFLWVMKHSFEMVKGNMTVQSISWSGAVPSTTSQYNIRGPIRTAETSAQASTVTPVTSSATEAAACTVDEVLVSEEERAELEAKGHELDRLARELELDMKTKAEEDLAMRNSCLLDDMREVVEQLVNNWLDTLKDVTNKGYLDITRATLMTEAALDLIRHQEDKLIQDSHNKGLGDFGSSLVTDDFFGKTARSVARIDRERTVTVGQPYPFRISRPSAQEIATQKLHSEDDYEFLVQYLLEEAVMAVSLFCFAPPFAIDLVLTIFIGCGEEIQ